MAVGNPYLEQFTNSIAEATQAANQMRQASLQQQELDQRSRAQAMQQAMQQQELAQNRLKTQTDLNTMGAQPVSTAGTVRATLPDMYGAPQAASIPDALSGIAGHPAFQSQVPAGLGDRLITHMPDGTSYELPTAQEQFARALSQHMQQENAMLPIEREKAQLGYVGVPDQVTQTLGLPPGFRAPIAEIPGLENASVNANWRAGGGNGFDQKALEASSAQLAKDNGISLKQGIPAWTQLPPELRAYAVTKAKELEIPPTKRSQAEASIASSRANTALTQAQMQGARQMVQGIANGTLPPDVSAGRLSPIVQGGVAAQGTNLGAAKADYRANAGSLSALIKNRDAVMAFEDTAGKNLDLFIHAAQRVVDSGSPWINAPLRAVAKQGLGSADQAVFDGARLVAMNEIAKVTSNPGLSGQLSVTAMNEMNNVLHGDASLSAIVGVAKLLKKEMYNRQTSLDKRISMAQEQLKQKPSNIKNADNDPMGIR